MANRRQVQQDRLRNQRRAERAAARKRRNIQIVAAVAALAVAGLGIGVAATTDSSSTSSNETTTTQASGTSPASVDPVAAGKSITGATPCPAVDGSSERTSAFAQAPSMCIDPAKKYTADFDTNQGHIVVDLDTTVTPQTANNFVVLSRYKYYDGTAIFRTDQSIDIVQGGSPSTQSASDPGPGYNIVDEPAATADKKFAYTAGDLVMARSSGPNSAGAQYFFGTGPKVANLDSQGTYVKFGHVSQGLDVLTKIMGLHVDSDDGLGGGPKEPVIVNHITITEH
jgi:cyclophilin family peptidyl-prolyl cis-trans isomerase